MEEEVTALETFHDLAIFATVSMTPVPPSTRMRCTMAASSEERIMPCDAKRTELAIGAQSLPSLIIRGESCSTSLSQ